MFGTPSCRFEVITRGNLRQCPQRHGDVQKHGGLCVHDQRFFHEINVLVDMLKMILTQVRVVRVARKHPAIRRFANQHIQVGVPIFNWGCL